jgi:sec-independent protein translocase protein TatB
MFNFGWGELVLIGIVALIAIGPKELPTVLRTIGQMMGKVRRMANEFQGQFHEALREADLADLKKHADDMTSSLNETVSDFTQYDPLADTQKEIEQGFDLAAPVTADAAPAELPAPEAQTEKAPEAQTEKMPEATAAGEKESAPAEALAEPAQESTAASVPEPAPKKTPRKRAKQGEKESEKLAGGQGDNA